MTLTDEHKRTLLEIVWAVVRAQITAAAPPTFDVPDDPQLTATCGCFVTLHVAGQLRGCIGTFQANTPLHQTVADMAGSSLQDPRFAGQRIRADELDQLDIEISVLSPLQRTTAPLSLELGTHGIYIKKGFQSGCFLPQVAEETGWNAEQFLSHCCSHKAGLPANAWRDGSAEVYLFTAEVFGQGPDEGGRPRGREQ